MDEFRRRVSTELRHRKLSKRRASTEAGLSSTTIQLLLQSKRLPEHSTLQKIAAYFGWSLEDVLRWVGVLPKRCPRDPLQELRRILDAGPWSAQERDAIYTLASSIALLRTTASA
jgi:hypothetical protein